MKMMKNLTCLVVALALAAAILPVGLAEGKPAVNWYEVFVRSYQDSDGDGIGDLNGLRQRLDYIQDMGWGGIWVMPVMPSPSYHKYDVTDYCDIDPEYGTLEDMRTLAADCRERGIQLIVDLPVNHTSTMHPWFLAACDALRRGDVEDPFVGYYNFSQAGGMGFVPLEGTDWTYEERFTGGGMPDLNLDSPAVRAEIERILEFWLVDVGVDGFRLDAVTSYYTGDEAANIEFLRWLKKTCKALKPGSLLIGECWANLDTIARYYESGVDSFFLFPTSQAEGIVAAATRGRKPAEKFAAAWQKVTDAIPKGLLTPFLCNHDTGRTVGLVQGRSNPDLVKFAEGLLGTLNGSAFTYYGEEIGMVGSGDDPNKRLAMYWSDGDMTDQPPGATEVEYAYPSVEAQLVDEDSILRYVQAVNQARLAHPEIARGKNTFLLAEGSQCLMRRDLGRTKCLIAVNFSGKDEGKIEVGEWEIDGDIETGDGHAEMEGGVLTLPPLAIVILTR